MSEPLADRLKRFTPDGAALDRDALLFQAGRASVRPRRGWMLLALALVFSQAATLAVLWPRPFPSVGPARVGPSHPTVEPVTPTPSPDPSEWLTLNQQVFGQTERDLPSGALAGPLVPDEPHLRVSTRLSDLNID
jgi:hypothetical protein